MTPHDHLVLRLPFPVEEEVIVDRSYATRPLFEGWARRVRHRVVVLDATGARLFEGEGDHVAEVEAHGFPVRVAATDRTGHAAPRPPAARDGA